MKMFITGGAGFIGSNFIFYMRKTHPDYDLVCLDKLTYAGNLETLAPVMNDPKFKFVRIDIADRKAVYDLFEAEKPDVVVNFAAERSYSAAHFCNSVSLPRYSWVRERTLSAFSYSPWARRAAIFSAV